MSQIVHVGIDFGTSQTKVCIQHLKKSPRVHEFLQFERRDGSQSFFFPSRVSVEQDKTLRFGFDCDDDVATTYGYFKIASAEDVVFRLDSGHEVDKPQYDLSAFRPFTPELLSVFFLTAVILHVREHLRSTTSVSSERTSGLLRDRQSIESNVQISIQLGIPTEYSSHVNYLRRRKFETILLLASYLADEVGSSKRLREIPWPRLRERVEVINRATIDQTSTNEAFEEELNGARLSVFPESASGLTFLVHTGKINPGYYSSMDIGGGSSDLSFFHVTSERQINYLASESVMHASNSVYRQYGGRDEGTLAYLSQCESEVRRRIAQEGDRLLQDGRYERAVTSVVGDVYRTMYRVFNGRVYSQLRKRRTGKSVLRDYRNQPCFVYGGGSILPLPMEMQKIRVHDQGRSDVRNDDDIVTVVTRDPVQTYVLNPDRTIKPRDRLSAEEAALLVVAYGLSFPQIESRYLWNDDLYVRDLDHEDTASFRDALFIFDVIQRGWRGRPTYIDPRWVDAPQPVSVFDELDIIPLAVRRRVEKQQTLTGRAKVKCPNCSDKGKIKWIVGHLLLKHGDAALERYLTSRELVVSQERKDTFRIRYCAVCDVLFTNWNGLKNHVSKKHPRVKCAQDGCKRRFRKEDDSQLCPECREERDRHLQTFLRRRRQRRRNRRKGRNGGRRPR